MSGIHYKNGGYVTTSVKPTLTRNRGGSSVAFSFNPTYNDATTSIIDRSSNALAVTNSGAVYSSATPFSGTNKGSIYFDGATDYITASNAAVNFGTGDFTIMTWANWTSTTSYAQIYGASSTNSFQTLPALHIFGNGSINMWVNGGFAALSGASNVLTSNVWGHLALIRASGTTKIYINGVSVASTTASYDVNSSFIRIGCPPATDGGIVKYSNYFVIKGTALYTANFTPPLQSGNEPLGSLDSTSLVSTTTYGVYKLGY